LYKNDNLLKVGHHIYEFAWKHIKRSIYIDIKNSIHKYELEEPVHFEEDAIYVRTFPHRVRIGEMTDAKIRLKKLRASLQGAVMYTIRARPTSSDEPSEDSATTEANVGASTCMRLLVAWKIINLGRPQVLVMLLEDDNTVSWDEDRLRQLVRKHENKFIILNSKAESTWLMQNGEAFNTVINILGSKKPTLYINISGAIQTKYTKKSIWHDHRLC
jgi:hypothetical protein